MSVPTLSNYAAQVLVADVVSVESRWADRPRRIESVVRLENIEHWKGGYNYAPTSFDLIVPGGKIGTTTMRICCAPQYKQGERWILFLLPDYKTAPTVGLGQGAFRIIKDSDGAARVYQSEGIPVTGISSNGWVQTNFGERVDLHQHLRAASEGVRLNFNAFVRDDANLQALPIEAFRAAIQPMLDASRDHGLRRPAGRHIPTMYHPTSIKPIGAVASGDRATSPKRPKLRTAATTRNDRSTANKPERNNAPATQIKSKADNSESNVTRTENTKKMKSNKTETRR